MFFVMFFKFFVLLCLKFCCVCVLIEKGMFLMDFVCFVVVIMICLKLLLFFCCVFCVIVLELSSFIIVMLSVFCLNDDFFILNISLFRLVVFILLLGKGVMW